jgi:DNA-binding XRE family transcriptional regulator
MGSVARHSHSEVIAKLMKRPAVRKEIERIEREEGALLDLLMKARQDAGLTQARVAELMGAQAPAIARLERSLATARHSASVATLRRCAQACGKQLKFQLS